MPCDHRMLDMPALRCFESLRTKYERDLRRELALQDARAYRIEPREVSSLPAPVRRFVVSAGLLGHLHSSNARVVWRTMQLRSAANAAWMNVECEQVSFFREPARLALMRSRLGGLVAFSGYDRYCDGRGRMFINIAGALPLQRVYGRHMDDSALVTYLSEAMLLPVLFVDPRLQWMALDERAARATLHHAGSSVCGVFTFDPTNGSVRFESDDRWRDGRVPARQRWTAEVRAFAWHEGVRVPGEVSAQWHGDPQSFTYMRGRIESIRYDAIDPRALGVPRQSLAAHVWREACSALSRKHEHARRPE